VADRQALLAEQREVMRQSAAASSADFGDGDGDDDAPAPAAVMDDPGEPAGAGAADDGAAEETPAPAAETVVESVGGDDVEEVARRRPKSLRSYKIQEVIKRRQIVLVQVVKEERGTKGAALTTYLSLAGRYCVLMPNTARGGGVSRKITNAVDRKRLKSIAGEMDIPDGMAVIIRTAGSLRTKPEIKRDYEYLLRLWDSVRDLTLKSTAPALVYEEANLIKRSIRDLYSRDIDDILVDGEEGYRLAKDFMRMLTPSHAKKVQLFKDPGTTLFQKFQVEAQLDAMHSAVVQLRSGGYVVINQTEALVAIDVNSGRSTKERHIEETALKTNCEAADEIARQLRLRDLAGLIVIDFIDMEESKNNHTVERRLKEAMRFDRARIQLGKISAFGLLELSRQRLRPSLMETSFLPCTHCGGTGIVRSVESSSVHVLRAIEEEGTKRRSSEITVTVHPSVALYVLNQKRADLGEIEQRYAFKVFLHGDEELIPPAFRMDRVRSETPIELPPPKPMVIEPEPEDEIDEVEDEAEEAPSAVETRPAAEAGRGEAAPGEDADGAKRRRRRRRRRGRREDGDATPARETTAGEGEPSAAESAETETTEEADSEGSPPLAGETAAEASARRRRRGKRGGRRRHRRDELPAIGGDEGPAMDAEGSPASDTVEAETVDAAAPTIETAEVVEEPTAAEKPKRVRRKPAAKDAAVVDASPEPAAEEPAAKPKRRRAPRKGTEAAEVKTIDIIVATPAPAPEAEPEAEASPPPAEEAAPAEPAGPPRKGWWNRFL
ncbi:MAG TPA: ribonuclease E/G, partial [Rhodospirillaceae bacterium]|nr:ribonuclease E/G [Rhodospirillaceae bacterium]